VPEVVGVRFRNCGKIYDFEVNSFKINVGDLVVVESEFGLSIGTVVIATRSVEKPEKELKKVLHLASEGDLEKKKDNEKFEDEAKDFCLERIMARGIPMQLICSEATLDRRRIVFYFTADGRIDFRELVKDLAAKFKTRIEMRQIGVRDKAKLVGGLGLCGKELCCRLFLTSFEPISIRMAKEQELVLNTNKLSGVCGRLMCCLGYEYSSLDDRESSIPDEDTIAISEEEELLEIITEDPNRKPPEEVCAPVEVSAAADARTEKQDEQNRPAHSRKHKRRKRRKRRRKFPKK
jgi:cell fate regulator YaaT (PSP1 superfamily)